MCQNITKITNKYTGQELYVPCGHCSACLQKKAFHRARYIKNSCRNDSVFLFVTLTYDNDFVPYIRRSDFYKAKVNKVYEADSFGFESSYKCVKTIPVYRRSYIFLKGGKHIHPSDFTFNYNENIIGYVDLDLVDFDLSCQQSNLTNFNDDDCIGICFYKDVQNFVKRLRINLNRLFNYDDSFKFFSTSEYGGKTLRPHFHLLIRVPIELQSKFRIAISRSWLFSDRYRLLRGIEVARDAANYVSTYVNSSHACSIFLFQKALRSKCSYSHGFGMDVQSFSYTEIQKKVAQRNLRYNVSVNENGVPVVRSLLFPKYVINRLFPKFKGYFRLDVNTIRFFLLQPQHFITHKYLLEMDSNQAYRAFVLFSNKISSFVSETGLSLYDYVDLYIDVYNLYFSNLLEESYFNCTNEIDILENFDNILDYYTGDVDVPSLDVVFKNVSSGFEVDPNKFRRNVSEDISLNMSYQKFDKYKKFNSFISNHL